MRGHRGARAALSFIDIGRRARLRALRADRTRRARTRPATASTCRRASPGYYFWRDRRHGPHHAALGVVRHQVAERADRRAADRLHDLVRAAAVLRPVARAVAEGSALSGRRSVDRQARHDRARALSHRSGRWRHPPDRAEPTAPTRPLPRPVVLRARRGHGRRRTSTSRPAPERVRVPALRLRRAGGALRRRRRHHASGRSRRFRSATSSGCARAARVRRRTPTACGFEPLRARSSPRATPRTICTSAQFRRAPRRRRAIRKGRAGRLAWSVDAPRADEAPAPVARAQRLDAHDAASSSARARTGRRRSRCATCEARRPVGREEEQVARRARSSRLTVSPTRYCSRTSRGSAIPCCAKTYCAKPLQSKPGGIGAAVAVRRAPAAPSAVAGDARSRRVHRHGWPDAGRAAGGGRASPASGRARRRRRRDAHAPRSRRAPTRQERRQTQVRDRSPRSRYRCSPAATGALTAMFKAFTASASDTSSASGTFPHDTGSGTDAADGADAPPERVVRASQGRPLAEGDHALVPGEGRGHLGLRPGDPGGLVQLQAAVGHPPAPLHQDQAPVRLRAVLAREHLRARRPPLPVLRRRASRRAS